MEVQRTLKILPYLGRKTNCPADSNSMFQSLSDSGSVLATFDAGGVNFDLRRDRNSCMKSRGFDKYTSAPNSEATKCFGLKELYDGTNRNFIMFDNGKVFVVNSSTLALDDITASGVTFANSNIDLYSSISFGGYMIFADRAEHTPYKWTHGDAEVSKLILSGTEYKFRYLEEFQNRIIGAYSDQTNGDLEIRWTDALPPWATLDFPDANQLYKPIGDDRITGIKRLGTDTCILYSENSISRIEYYPTTSPFSLVRSVAGYGASNHHSIVSARGSHFFFCTDYGFCRYDGGAEFPSGGAPISENIEQDVATISREGQKLIVGTYLPIYDEICWAVPLNASTYNTHLLFYNLSTGQWRLEDKRMTYVNSFLVGEALTWAQFATEIGGTSTWGELDSPTLVWASFAPQLSSLVFASTDGHIYRYKTESLDGAPIDGYRIEPMLDFGQPLRRDTLTEIWLDIAQQNNVSISIWWRGGDTVGELETMQWENLGTVTCNNLCAYLATYRTARIHQIKWGTSGANEPFNVPGITMKYIPQGLY